MDSKKGSPLYILNVLREETDGEHFLTQNQIRDLVEKRYGIHVERKSISDTLNLLEEAGYDINKAPNGKGVALISHLFDDSQIAFLVDSILSSKSITSKQASELIKQIYATCSKHSQHDLESIQKSTDTSRAVNEQLFFSIDRLSEAIRDRKMVKFDYWTYDISGNLVPPTEKKYYKVNPCFLVNNFGSYYFIANYTRHPGLVSFRIEFMREVQVLDEPAKKLEDIPEIGVNFNLSQYLNEHIYLFGGQVEDVTFSFQSEYMFRYVFEWFGKSARIKKDGDHYVCSVRCDDKAFFYWAMQYGDNIEVLTPKSLRKDLLQAAKNMLAKYETEPAQN